MSGIPQTSKGEPSPKQKQLLESLGKWKDGMSVAEASAAIDALPKQAYMKPGIHEARIKSIEDAVDKDKKPITDKDDFPSLRIVFENKEGEIASDIFSYNPDPSNGKKCASEWKLNVLKAALGIKESDSKSTEEVKKITLYVFIKEVTFVDKSGNVVIVNGKEKIRTELMAKFNSTAQAKPIVASSEFAERREWKGAVDAPAVGATPLNNNQPNQEASAPADDSSGGGWD